MADTLKFGTSGLRGLASQLEGQAARRYVAAFLGYLGGRGLAGQGEVFIARDLRDSSASIAADCAAAIAAAGLMPVDCGVLPTPALALHAMALGAPSIMVTGSHIPADRNGLKFYTPLGEITKQDEAGISAALTDAEIAGAAVALDGYAQAGDRYRQRYRHFLPPTALGGWRIGVFEHSSAARDLLCSLLTRAGATVVRLGREERFVAVDTEAFSDAIFQPRHDWISAHRLDAVVSTDGDADRPLVIDGNGDFIRGDALGLLTAQFLGADTVVTPVTSNSAIEIAGSFQAVLRTRVGSPYVIAGMADAEAAGGRKIVGFGIDGERPPPRPPADARRGPADPLGPGHGGVGGGDAGRTGAAPAIAGSPQRPADRRADGEDGGAGGAAGRRAGFRGGLPCRSGGGRGALDHRRPALHPAQRRHRALPPFRQRAGTALLCRGGDGRTGGRIAELGPRRRGQGRSVAIRGRRRRRRRSPS